MDEELVDVPADVRVRLNDITVESLVQRVDALTVLVALQETELAIMWLVILGLACIGVKKYTDLSSSNKETHGR
jgi:hypothetical protein